MALFLLGFDRRDWYRYQIDAHRPLQLPTLACSACGSRWKSTGEAYPSFDVDSLKGELNDLGDTPLDAAEFDLLRQRLRPLTSPVAPLSPGTGLGPLAGTFTGRPLDVVWLEPWVLLFSSATLELLQAAGIELGPLGRAELVGAPVPLWEPDAIPLIELSPRSWHAPGPSLCQICGRLTGSFDSPRISAKSSMLSGTDLCRPRNLPTKYVVSERFAHVVATHKLTGITCSELPLE